MEIGMLHLLALIGCLLLLARLIGLVLRLALAVVLFPFAVVVWIIRIVFVPVGWVCCGIAGKR
jgi:hypothetical protein